MRDAFGGAFMIKLFLVFIIIYVSFTALALNYAKAFKVKNKVVEYIEQNEIVDFQNMPASTREAMDLFFEQEMLGNMNYKSELSCDGENVVYCHNGIRIQRAGKGINTTGAYYKVTTSFGWTIPFINKLLELSGRNGDVAFGTWEISGETRLIVKE